MDPVSCSLAVVSVLAQVMNVARSICDIHKHVQEVPEDMLSILVILEDVRGWAELYTAAGQIIPRMESIDKNIAMLLGSYREAYTRRSSVVLRTEVRDWTLHCWKSEALRLSTRRERAMGTCEWILTDGKFLQWRDTMDTSLLWVSGSPGAGKSTLSSAIIDSLEADTSGRKTVAYYFIDGRFESSSTALDILLAITVKMLSREISGESRGRLESLLNDLDAAGEEMSSSQVGEFLLRIRHNLSSEETLYLIIDGLDEARGSQNTRGSLQEIIYQGNQYNRWHPMKLFVSSRSDFLVDKHITGALHMDIDQEAFVQKDRTIYINQTLEEAQLSQISQVRYSVETRFGGALNDFEVVRATSAAPSLFETQEIGQLGATCIHTARDCHRDELVRRISAYASGTFLWVRLLVTELSKASFSQVSVDHLLDGHITDDLFGIYEHMIRVISEKDRPVALQMLRWVTYAARPLSGGELLSAIALQTNIKLLEADIQRVCGGLLRSSNGGVVSLVHLTLRDFLESRSGENDVLGWRPVSNASNEMIAHICLKVLGSELFLESLDILIATQNTTGSKIRRFDALESYAYHNWKFHYTRAEHQSSYLPGMLREKFRKAWENGAFAPSNAFAPAAIRMDEKSGENQNYLKRLQWASDEPLNAGLRAGARYGMIKLVKLQLQMGVSPNVVDVVGNTPLHYAAAAGNLEMMRLLIQHGANVQAVSEAGETALHSAIANGQSEGVKLLLKAGARPFDISTRSSHDQFAQILNRSTSQKLYLVVALSEICAACGDLQSHYILSLSPKNDKDSEIWPPIYVRGEAVSLNELDDPEAHGYSTFFDCPIVSEEITIISWFPGANMYKALCTAARSGMEDVIRLLVAAGNDTKFLDRNISLSRIMSKMKIF